MRTSFNSSPKAKSEKSSSGVRNKSLSRYSVIASSIKANNIEDENSESLRCKVVIYIRNNEFVSIEDLVKIGVKKSYVHVLVNRKIINRSDNGFYSVI